MSNIINIVLTVYKRPQYLKKQLEMIKSQTCIDSIVLHVISNNLDIDFLKIIEDYQESINIKFVQKNNEFASFERHYYSYQQGFEYVIFIDDDIFVAEDAIEKIFDQREKGVLKGHWLRKFIETDFIENLSPYTGSEVSNYNSRYNYVGGNLCLLDNKIFDLVVPLFEKYKDKILKDLGVKLERIDDLFLSWVADTNGYKIESFGIKPTEFLGNDDVALYREDMKYKDSVTKYLHKIKKWNFYNKNFLIFTSIGDISHQCFSWLENRSNVYDRACVYFGENPEISKAIRSKSPEYYYESKGMVWKNFADRYEDFKDYDYVLVVDSDLSISPVDIEKTFLIASKNNWTACQWSRDEDSFGVFTEIYSSQGSGTRETNFIEMLFMMIRKDVLKDLVEKWREMDLEYSTGIDLILSNIAIHNGYNPFYVIDDFYFYNPSPQDKNGSREIDQIADHFQRTEKLFIAMKSNKHYWVFGYPGTAAKIKCGKKLIKHLFFPYKNMPQLFN